MGDREAGRVGITPKSWTSELHHGVLHLGKRWYVISAELDEHGRGVGGVRLDGPFADKDAAEAQAGAAQAQAGRPGKAE